MALLVSAVAHVGAGSWSISCGTASSEVGTAVGGSDSAGTISKVIVETGAELVWFGRLMMVLGFAQIVGAWSVLADRPKTLFVIGSISTIAHVWLMAGAAWMGIGFVTIVAILATIQGAVDMKRHATGVAAADLDDFTSGL